MSANVQVRSRNAHGCNNLVQIYTVKSLYKLSASNFEICPSVSILPESLKHDTRITDDTKII